MTADDSYGTGASGTPRASNLEMKLEVVVIPVADVDRAKAFYLGLGWRLDADVASSDHRLVQLTPPGSGCSIQFCSKVTAAEPGSAQDLYLVVSDIDAARNELIGHGVDVGEVFHCATGFSCRFRVDGPAGRVTGPADEHGTYRSFAVFSDPDGNGWLLQEITKRLPGRVEPAPTSFGSAGELAAALRRAAAAHGEHEKRIGAADPNWPDWYADYMVREQSGAELPV
jgi:catechol 2,3-dioxygenase-like lactoylglutathione lyase family enzyme